MDVKLGYSREDTSKKNTDNSRNGYTPKTVRSELGPIHLDIPRDRKGEFEPKIVPKYKLDVSGIEEKIISLYARGMSTRDIHDQIKDLKNLYAIKETGLHRQTTYTSQNILHKGILYPLCKIIAGIIQVKHKSR